MINILQIHDQRMEMGDKQKSSNDSFIALGASMWIPH